MRCIDVALDGSSLHDPEGPLPCAIAMLTGIRAARTSSQGRRGLRGVGGWRAQALNAREPTCAGELEKRARVLIGISSRVRERGGWDALYIFTTCPLVQLFLKRARLALAVSSSSSTENCFRASFPAGRWNPVRIIIIGGWVLAARSSRSRFRRCLCPWRCCAWGCWYLDDHFRPDRGYTRDLSPPVSQSWPSVEQGGRLGGRFGGGWGGGGATCRDRGHVRLDEGR